VLELLRASQRLGLGRIIARAWCARFVSPVDGRDRLHAGRCSLELKHAGGELWQFLDKL